MGPEALDELDKVRFCVVDADSRAISDLWFLQGHGANLYVAPRKLGGQLKLSLHPPGGAADGCDCQFGQPKFQADHQRSLGFKAMPPVRWTRPPTPSVGALHIVSIMFPTDYLGGAPQPPDDGKPKFGLIAAPPGHAVEVGLFISRQGPNELDDGFLRMGGLPLTCTDLANGDFVSLVVRQRPFSGLEEALQKLASLEPVPLSGAPKTGETIEGRAIIVGEVPRDGKAFQLTEVGPLKVRRNAPN